MALMPVDEALARVLDAAAPLGNETVGLLEAPGRVLAEPIAASWNQPPFNASAMDGYAVRGADVATAPVTLSVIGESQAGRGLSGAVQPGQAARIFTGAPVPEGADTVIIQENTERNGDRVIVREACDPGTNIRPAGGDFKSGETLLSPGRYLDPGAIMLAAAAGNARLSVRRKPTVAILATGDELVEPGTHPGAEGIVSSNPYGLAALIANAGGAPHLLGIARDTHESLAQKLNEAAGSDVLITIGGASVGDHDLVKPALEAYGLNLDFWKVAMRPGKPMLFARSEALRVLGLPGNPLSCLIAAQIFLVPLIYRLLGRSDSANVVQSAVLTRDLPANGPRQHYMRASLLPVAGEMPRAAPISQQDSAFITGLVAADALIIRPPNAPPAHAGDRVPYLPLHR